MMSASEGGEGGHGKLTWEGRLSEFYSMNQFQMRTRGSGSKNPKLLWTSLMDAPIALAHFFSRFAYGNGGGDPELVNNAHDGGDSGGGGGGGDCLRCYTDK